MKKLLAVCVLLVCVILYPISAFAETSVVDSFTIDNETSNILSISENDTAIRIYGGYFLYGFSQRKSLDEIFNDDWSLHFTSYLIISSDANGEVALTNKSIEDGVAVDANKYCNYYNPEFYELIDDNERILSVLSPFIKVQKTIYINGLPHDGMYIYYQTSIGDYVYYKASPDAENEYLLPLDDFYDFAEVTFTAVDGNTGGQGTSMVQYDLTPYSIDNYLVGPRHTFRVILCWSIPLLVIVACCLWVFIHRKKT